VQIADHTDAIATGAVYRNDCFHAQLVLVRDVKQAGINRAGRPLILVEIACFSFEAELGDRHQAVYELGQAEILHPGFEVGHTVLERAAPIEELWVVSGRHQPCLPVKFAR